MIPFIESYLLRFSTCIGGVVVLVLREVGSSRENNVSQLDFFYHAFVNIG